MSGENLHILPIYLLAGIQYLFLQEIPAYTVPVSVPVSARLHRRLRGLIAVASRRVAARNAGDLPTSLELQLPTRCTRTEEVEPRQRAMGEAMMRLHVKVIVERL